MEPLQGLGKTLVVLGLVLAAVGLGLMFSDKLPLGRLPGDIAHRGERFSFYFPIVTCLVISIVATILLNIFRK